MKYLLSIISLVAFTLLGMGEVQAQKTFSKDKAQLKKEKVHRPSLEIWQKRLQLTDTQVDNIQPAFDVYLSQLEDLKEDETLTAAEKKETAITYRNQYDEAFRKELTAEQVEKFNRFRPIKKPAKAKRTKRLKK